MTGSLASCHLQFPTDEARVLYAELLDQLLARGGAGEETAVHLARALADLAEEVRGGW